MQRNNDIDELTIENLFVAGTEYVIPLYQRNYAWQAPEIEQLLQDILDSAEVKNYYLGTLVISKRDNGQLEIIDGQQRYTTLAILLAVLRKEFTKSLENNTYALNLHFESRPQSGKSLTNLFYSGLTRECAEPSMRNAYLIIKKFLSVHETDLSKFIRSLSKTIKLLRVSVPEKTNLNHYFEVMNNRGEQLEKHEILKAELMASFIATNTDASKQQKHQQKCFAMIWDACSDMNRYAIANFTKVNRDKLFTNSDRLAPDFAKICAQLSDDKIDETQTFPTEKITTLADIINKVKAGNAQITSINDKKEEQQRFTSVINFPNFLLHILRLHCPSESIKLDDKTLIQSFHAIKEPLDAGAFAVDLLKYRLLFDRYIIKRENDKDWILKTFDTSLNPANSFGKHSGESEDSALNTKLIMLQSMFHVSYPAQSSKYWLAAVLNYLNHQNDSTALNGDDFVRNLEELSDRFFFENISKTKDKRNSYQELIQYPFLSASAVTTDFKKSGTDNQSYDHVLHVGTDVHNFIFNRLDYLLWKNAKSEGWLENQFPVKNQRKFILAGVNKFKYTFRSSVEHYYPQHPESGTEFSQSDIFPYGVDSFGNLCLISSCNNSKLTNRLPLSKKEVYQKSETIESLKQVFMMSYEDWGHEPEQALLNMKSHQEMMIDVLTT